jgi:hypothetical protein
MPTVLFVGPYRFYFYSSDRKELKHIHVERDDKDAKFWLEPIRLSSSGGYSRAELLEIQKIIDNNIEDLISKWNEYFSNR